MPHFPIPQSSDADRSYFLSKALPENIDWWAKKSGVLCGPKTRVYAGYSDYPRLVQFGCNQPDMLHSEPLCCSKRHTSSQPRVRTAPKRSMRTTVPTDSYDMGFAEQLGVPAITMAAVAAILLVVLVARMCLLRVKTHRVRGRGYSPTGCGQFELPYKMCSPLLSAEGSPLLKVMKHGHPVTWVWWSSAGVLSHVPVAVRRNRPRAIILYKRFISEQCCCAFCVTCCPQRPFA